MPLATIVTSLTNLIGDYGLYAVFFLMLIDAVFPAASELVMVYAGAIASGALAGQTVTLFGYEFQSGFPAYVAMALAGTIGYTIGAIGGWALGDYLGRPYLERHGRWLHLDAAKLDRAEAWFQRWEDWAVLLGRLTPVVRSFISIPAGVFRVPFWRYTVLTLIGSMIGWWIGDRGGRPYLERHGRWLHLDHARLERAEAWFQKWEDWAVLVGRLTPVVRSFISIPAGIFEVPFRRYTVLTLIGSAFWCFTFAAVGWAAGASWESFHSAFRYADVAVALLVLGTAGWLGRRALQKRRLDAN